ncbi:protein HID1-like [Hylaeus volcanicus]|uniref:protein HID1-like n=1 Tax=Hylaeus volcanicus TaxID=313075 RepID=UPI0023B7A66C|nr:protein HID1-like [Hylaeus volcanicus]
MGATESKIDPQFLSRFVLDSKRFENDEYWKHLFRSPVTREFLQNHLSIDLIRKARQSRNPNLVDFFHKVLDALQEVIDCGHKGNLGGAGCSVARNCLCLLTHILPVFLEIPLPHELNFLETSNRSQQIVSDSSFVYTLFWLAPHQNSTKGNIAFDDNLHKGQINKKDYPPNQIIGNEDVKGNSIEKLKVQVMMTDNSAHKLVGELDKKTDCKKHLSNSSEATQDFEESINLNLTNTKVSVKQTRSNLEENTNILRQSTDGIENTEDQVNHTNCYIDKTTGDRNQKDSSIDKTTENAQEITCCVNKDVDDPKKSYSSAKKIRNEAEEPCCCVKKTGDEKTGDEAAEPCCCARNYEKALDNSTKEGKRDSNVSQTAEQLQKVINEEPLEAAKMPNKNSDNPVVCEGNSVIRERVDELNKNLEQLNLIGGSFSGSGEEEQMQPLAIKILSALQHLLFLKNFTLLIPNVVFPENYVSPRQKVNAQLLWNGVVGGGKNSSYCKLSNDIYSNRKAVLTCLLVCLSSQVYRSQLTRIKSPPCLWLWVFTQGSMPYIGNLYCSLMSLVFSKTSSSLLGFEFGSSKASFSYENDLRSIAAKLFCVLINFDTSSKCEIPLETKKILLSNRDANQDEIISLSNSNHELPKPQFFNIYRLMLAAMKNEKEIAAVYDEICSQIKSSSGAFHSKFSSPSTLKNSCTEEHLLILWNLLISNKWFLQHATQKNSISKLLVPLLYTMLEASAFLHEPISSEKKHSMETSIVTGVLHLCSLIVFVLSAEREFATQANEQFNETLPFNFTFYQGSYADFIILSFYQICTSELMSVENESLIDIFLTTLCNMSPYLRSLCPESSMKLVSLFQRLSRPHWLFEQPYRYRNTFLLFEIFDNIIQYQYTGNYNLIYSILRQKNVFEAFHFLEFTKFPENVPQKSPDNTTPDTHQQETHASRHTPKTSTEPWCATQEWFDTWKAEAPTQTVMCVINKLIPLVNDMCANDEFPEQTAIIDMIKSTMLVGILPVPPSILIRNYVPHITTNQWFVTFTWRIIALKLRNEFRLPNLLLFNIETTE